MKKIIGENSYASKCSITVRLTLTIFFAKNSTACYWIY